jgi:hypothetical protein
MALSTVVKKTVNRLLGGANLRLETRTETRTEEHRLACLQEAGHFNSPAFPLPNSFQNLDVSELVRGLRHFRDRFDTFRDASKNDVGFSFRNNYFRSPDAEILYIMVHTRKPSRVIEIGSGNSTKVARQAILDGKLNTRLTSIDPRPRAEIDSLVDQCVRHPVESLNPTFFDILQQDDILFIDSSHELRVGNDCAFLYSTILPRLAAGVMLQIHDVFLPYDYPADLLETGGDGWNEQYLVQAILTLGGAFDVIWPGYFLQRTWADFAALFPHNTGERAQSLWLRKTSAANP